MVLNSKTITEGVGVRVCVGYKSLLDSSEKCLICNFDKDVGMRPNVFIRKRISVCDTMNVVHAQSLSRLFVQS